MNWSPVKPAREITFAERLAQAIAAETGRTTTVIAPTTEIAPGTSGGPPCIMPEVKPGAEHLPINEEARYDRSKPGRQEGFRGKPSKKDPGSGFFANSRWFFLTLIWQISVAYGADWQSYQHDPGRTGYSNVIVNPTEVTLSWSAPIGYSTPIIVGDTVYGLRTQGGISGGDNRTLVSAFDLLTGTVKWTYSGDFSYPSQAAAGGGFVVFHSGILENGEQLFVLDAMTGALRYTVHLPSSFTATMPLLIPNPNDGTVMAYFTDPNTLYAAQLGPTSGFERWRAHTWPCLTTIICLLSSVTHW